MKFRGEFSFLSNFTESPLEYKGFSFPTAEHAYQAAKAVFEEDFHAIRTACSPVVAKRMGQKIKVRDDWNKVKVSVMREILEIKFSIPEFEQRLLKIEGPIVEENNWGDTFWGVCDGKGKNNLGKILMRLRDEKVSFLTT